MLGDDGASIPLTRQQRTILGRLAINRRQVVPTPTLLRDLWGRTPGHRAQSLLYNLIRQLRGQLAMVSGEREQPVLQTQPPGYRLVLDAELDLCRFETLMANARAHLSVGNQVSADVAFGAALALWHGDPLGGVTQPFAEIYQPTFVELYLTAVEEWNDVQLSLGKHLILVADLTRLVAESPYRERLRGQLMLALYRSGRQLQALETYHEGRRILVNTSGLEPGPALRQLHNDILTEAGYLALPNLNDLASLR
jgi:DNA-binding SARP family transcriptional activator